MQNKKQRTFEEVIELATAKERHTIELKSSSFLIKDHPEHREPLTDTQLREKLKACLAKEAGAFANSAGGEIFFGFDDKNCEVQTEKIPSHFGR